jgi:cell division septation protein DedD
MLSFRIEPPPPVIVNPDVEEFLLEIPDAGAAADGPARDAPSGAPDAAAGVNGEGPFPPPGAMITGAGEMAPVISRMEPLGRRLDPANPVPKAVRIELKPPVPEEEAMTRRPRLTPPPRAPSGPPVQEAAPPVGEKRRYTVIAGSYIKEANAERQRDRLEQEGLPAEVVHVVVNNQPYWRVMSGVFEDHEAAEAYGRELKRRNLTESPYIKLL